MPALWSMPMFKRPAWRRGAVGLMEKRNCGAGMVSPRLSCFNCLISPIGIARADLEVAEIRLSDTAAVDTA